MKTATLGILTGISYVSGIDYFKKINEKVLADSPQGYIMSPNPPIVMVSIDCDEYVHYLSSKSFKKVDEHLLKGVRKLVAADCESCASKLKKQRFLKVGLIGTKPTMEENYLKDRLSLHGITTFVPEEEQAQEEIYEIICQELSYNVFTDESRAKMVKEIRRLEAMGAEACILGCTEIELLVQQEHVPTFPLLPSAEIHIETVANILLQKLKLEDVLPLPYS
jgi:aspartate/glutamate racemase